PIIADLETGNALAPVNPHAWARLAMVRLEADGPVAPVAAAVRMSILTGPHEHEFVFLRLALALSVWSWFGKEDRDLVRNQIRFAWDYSREDTVRLARNSQRLLVFRLAL